MKILFKPGLIYPIINLSDYQQDISLKKNTYLIGLLVAKGYVWRHPLLLYIKKKSNMNETKYKMLCFKEID